MFGLLVTGRAGSFSRFFKTQKLKKRGTMKQFLIINGKEARLIERATMEDAKRTAENICDHSKEIIVREIDFFINRGANFFNPEEEPKEATKPILDSQN